MSKEYSIPPPTVVMAAPNIKNGANRPNAVSRPPEAIMNSAVLLIQQKVSAFRERLLLIERIRGKFRTPLSDADTPWTDWKYMADYDGENSSVQRLHGIDSRR
jgi:hypothetical protein